MKKHRVTLGSLRSKPRLVAQWGQAHLVHWPDGYVRLHGGTASDRQMALEWISLFMPEALPVRDPSPLPPTRPDGFRGLGGVHSLQLLRIDS
ncbi:MAG: hypothetical protein NZM03_05280 [Limisphaera sp.]|nr:hypothetical protein [Limisphaera sp.]